MVAAPSALVLPAMMSSTHNHYVYDETEARMRIKLIGGRNDDVVVEVARNLAC
jgi:hypothetical protein